MKNQIAAAVFDSRAEAERAVSELREAGVPDQAISVISLHEDGANDEHGHVHETDDHHDNKATGALKGLAAGGAVGAIAGLGALAIPGVGPFIAAGAIAESLGVVGSAAAVSGAVGAAAGGLTGALVDYGVSREHAEHYERRIRKGAVFVGVETRGSERDYNAVRAVLRAAGGESADADARAEAHD